MQSQPLRSRSHRIRPRFAPKDRLSTLEILSAEYYYIGLIRSFKDARAEKLLNNERVVELVAIEDQARTRLIRLNAAQSLRDLAAFRGNRLEALKGKRAGQYSIRINDQFRICFKWKGKGPSDVEIVDYH
jgi:proteic killer suppression protein